MGRVQAAPSRLPLRAHFHPERERERGRERERERETSGYEAVAALCQRRFVVASISFPELSGTSLFQGMFQFSFSGSFPGTDINA